MLPHRLITARRGRIVMFVNRDNVRQKGMSVGHSPWTLPLSDIFPLEFGHRGHFPLPTKRIINDV